MDVNVPTVAKYAGAGLIAAYGIYGLLRLGAARGSEEQPREGEQQKAATPSSSRKLHGSASGSSAAMVIKLSKVDGERAEEVEQDYHRPSGAVAVGETIDGKTAASRVAYALSDVSFVYTSGSSDDIGEAVLAWSSKCTQNAFGRSGVVKLMAARAGAASVVHGALQDPSVRVSVFASSQSIPLMIPNMYSIASAGLPCVFHVAAQSVNADLTVDSDVMGVVAARNTGFAILAAYGGQECQDMAVIAHLATYRTRTPFLHFFDGVRASHELLQIRHVNSDGISQLIPSLNRASATPQPASPARRKLTDEELVSAVDATMAELEPVLGHRYRVFEYTGAADAKHVIVLLGLGASATEEVATFLNTQHSVEKVGVLKVRLYRPWSPKHFLAALPASVTRISVLEVCDPSVPLTAGPLMPDIAASFYSALWKSPRPQVQASRLAGGARKVTVGDVLAIFSELRAPTSAATPLPPVFLPTPEDRLSQLGNFTTAAALSSAPATPRKSAAKAKRPTSKEIVVWSTIQDGTEAMCQRLTTSLHQVYGLHTQLYTAHDSFDGKGTANSQLRVSVEHSHRHHEIVGADVVLVCDAAMLRSHTADILANLLTTASGRKSTLVVPLSDDAAVLDAALPSSLKSFIASEGVLLLCLDVASLAKAAPKGFEASLRKPVILQTALLLAIQDPVPYDDRLWKCVEGLLDSKDASALAALTVLAQQVNMQPASVPSSWIKLGSSSSSSLSLSSSTSSNDGERDVASDSDSAVGVFRPRLRVPKGKTAARKTSNTRELKEHHLAWNVIFKDAYQSEPGQRPGHPGLFRVKLTKNQRLTPKEYDRNIFHLEFDISGTGLKYEIGDALGVYGHNDKAEVNEFLEFFGLNPLDVVSIDHPVSEQRAEVLTVAQLFETRLDIFGKPTQQFYEGIAPYASDSYQRIQLEWLGTDDKEGFKLRQLESMTFADVLREFHSARPPLEKLVQLIPPIKPRHYSISSSMRACPNSVHLLVVLVDWVTPKGRKRYGHCTRFLAGLRPEDEDIYVTVDIKTSVMRLPADPRAPVIMAGLGTGMAPFRAFIQERDFQRKQGIEVGPMMLYFGARHRSEEYLYGEELDAFHASGVLTHLGLAFSRDQPKKIYIQHKILEDKAKIFEYMAKNKGQFYLCGPTWPVPDVRAALADSLREEGNMSTDHIDETIEEWKETGRYILEVY